MPTRTLLVVPLLVSSLGLSLVVLNWPSSSLAQGKAPGDRISQLERRLESLSKSSADASAALQTLQDLQRRLGELERAKKGQTTVGRGYNALRAQLDDLDQRLGNLQLQLTAVSLHGAERVRLLYERGLVLRAGRRFEARFGGLLQAGYAGQILSEERDYAGGDRFAKHGSALSLPRARIGTSGHVFDPRMQYTLGLEFGGRAERPLLDAHIQFGTPRIGVRAGLMRVPFGRQFALDLGRLIFQDRSDVTRAFHPGRDVGLRVHGALFESDDFGRLGVEMGVFNGGGGTPFDDVNTDFLYAARLVYEPLGALGAAESDSRRSSRPRLAVGGSFMFDLAPTDAPLRAGVTDPARVAELQDSDRDGEIDSVGIYSAAAELALLWRGLSVQGEFFYRREDPGAVGESRTTWGVYGQLAARHASGLEAAARYSYWELHRFGEDGAAMAPGLIHELAVALTAWKWGEGLKLQTTYAYRLMRDIADRRGTAAVEDQLRAHLLTVSAQLAW